MIYCYLFEAKSIQQYLFRSGKLKDVIAASERLDQLIDSTGSSILNQVLRGAQLSSDLVDQRQNENNDCIHFLRCKGGAFYSYCNSETPLLALRSLWTLTVQQLFPSLEFTDALTHKSTLPEALDAAHQQLASDRNSPTIKFPIASTISERYQRSGKVAVLSSIRGQEGNLDLDTSNHRHAYENQGMKHAAALQDRFTPESLRGNIHYPVDIEKEFQTSPDASASNQVATRDIALIHIDGNGLGILLMGLKEALKGKKTQEYQHGFRQFSQALSIATEKAAQTATQWIADNATYQYNGNDYLPMRPIVLGGDDLTLLCRADLALTFSQIFCTAFKDESELALKAVSAKYNIPAYLTASGGILFNKAGHPFTNSLHLVEDLCAHAKQLTKSVTTTQQPVGPAALAFYRISNTVSTSLDAILKQSQCFTLGDGNTINMRATAYFVEDKYPNSLIKLGALAECCREKNTVISMAKWRQMATLLAQGDLAEAKALFNRTTSLITDAKSITSLASQLNTLLGAEQKSIWYVQDGKQLRCIINDLLIVDHFRAVLAKKEKGESNE